MSETEKYLPLTTPYCVGNGVDIGSGGHPVVPWAIQVDLPQDEFSSYNSGNVPASPIQWRGSAAELPFRSNTLSFCYSSHLIEDFSREGRRNLFREWVRVLKPGGKLVVLAPDKTRWHQAILRGQPPNCAHLDEPSVGEMTEDVKGLPLKVLEDRLTDLSPDDYSILFVAEKTVPAPTPFLQAAHFDQTNPEWSQANPA